MSKNWKMKTLGEVCEVIAGQSPESRFYNKERKGLPFYQGKKDFGDIYIKPPTVWTEFVTKEATEGDILMSVRAPVGPTNFATEKICIGRGLAAIRAGEHIDKDYLFYFLNFFEESIETNKGAVFDSINKSQIESLRLPVPAIAEQKRIVGILDEKFGAIEELKRVTEQQITGAKELFESRLNEVFENSLPNWTNCILDDVVDVKGGKRIPKGYSLTKEKTEHPYIRVSDFDHNGSVDQTNIQYITNNVFQKISNYTISDNDVFIRNCLKSPAILIRYDVS